MVPYMAHNNCFQSVCNFILFGPGSGGKLITDPAASGRRILSGHLWLRPLEKYVVNTGYRTVVYHELFNFFCMSLKLLTDRIRIRNSELRIRIQEANYLRVHTYEYFSRKACPYCIRGFVLASDPEPGPPSRIRIHKLTMENHPETGKSTMLKTKDFFVY